MVTPPRRRRLRGRAGWRSPSLAIGRHTESNSSSHQNLYVGAPSLDPRFSQTRVRVKLGDSPALRLDFRAVRAYHSVFVGGSNHVFRTTKITIANVVVALGTAGCIDAFNGSNVQIELPTGTPVQARVGAAQGPTELPANSHYSLYRVDGTDLTELVRFEVHRLVDLSSPCFIDVGDHVPHAGLHVSQFAAKIAEDTGITDIANPPPGATEQQKIEIATAQTRQHNVEALAADMGGVQAITSASTAIYPAVAASCNAAPGEIPPPTCTDDASNAARLAACQASWDKDAQMWEGTDRVLTAPLHGTTYGLVDGNNPINQAPVNGGQFFLEDPLTGIGAATGFAIYTQVDGGTGPGTKIFQSVQVSAPTRGVTHVVLFGPGTPAITGFLAVFSDIGGDSVHF